MKHETSSVWRILTTILFLSAVSVLIGRGYSQEPKDESVSPVIKSSSSIGEVTFPHQFHFEDLELECQACHHETNATSLKMPHEDYFDDFWIDCKICHRGDGTSASQPRSCSSCHHDSPTSIADETLSTKVVIHKICWKCHEIEKGEKASQGCSDCHVKNPDKKAGLPVSSSFE